MAEISHSPVEGNPGARRVTTSPNHKFPEKWYSSSEFGSSALTWARPVRPLSTGYPQLNVDNYCGVWELELNALAVQRCSLRVVQILSLLVQPLPQLVLRF